MKSTMWKVVRGAAIGTAVLCGIAACASTPIPNEKLAVAKASVQRAEEAGAPQSAPVEFNTAQDKLTRAEKAVADHDAQTATMLAEQVNVDAQLAEATAREQQAHKAAMDFDASMQALRNESMRSTQSTQ